MIDYNKFSVLPQWGKLAGKCTMSGYLAIINYEQNLLNVRAQKEKPPVEKDNEFMI